MTTISVVIPTFKNRGGLTKSIDSALNQDYKGLIEVIVVDDNNPNTQGRKDTEEMISNYSYDSRVVYLKHEHNKNGSAARNTGIFAAKGDLIALLDDDDMFLEGKLSKQITYLDQHPEKDAVCCFEHKEGREVNRKIHEGDATRDILMLQSNFQTSTLVFRKYVLEKLHGFDESFTRHQDVELMLRFYAEGFSLGCVPEVLVEMGKNLGENIPSGEKLENLKKHFFEKFRLFIEKENIKTPGFASQVYAKHYAGVFLSHVKHHYYGKAIKVFAKSFYRAPEIFITLIYNHFKLHIR